MTKNAIKNTIIENVKNNTINSRYAEYTKDPEGNPQLKMVYYNSLRKIKETYYLTMKREFNKFVYYLGRDSIGDTLKIFFDAYDGYVLSLNEVLPAFDDGTMKIHENFKRFCKEIQKGLSN